MRSLAGPSRRRFTNLAYICLVLCLLSYASIHVRQRLASAYLERSDREILLRTWRVKEDGKLVVPFDPQGSLVRVNANESDHTLRHPLYHMILDAERKWKDLVDRSVLLRCREVFVLIFPIQRQSKSLEETVTEYQRRYRHLPPKGFDQWYVLDRASLVDPEQPRPDVYRGC